MIQIARDEEVILEVRHHWYFLFVQSAFLLVLILIPFSVSGFLSASHFLVNGKMAALLVFAGAAWFLLVWVSFFAIWTSYYLDIWIVTNKRVIAVEQHTLFNREVSEFRLEKIQDISIEVRGLIPTLLHFGDLEVQTASETASFRIRNIPNPDKAKEVIFKEHDRVIKASRQSTL